MWLTSCFNGKIHMTQIMIHPVAVRSLLNMKNGIWGTNEKVSAKDVECVGLRQALEMD